MDIDYCNSCVILGDKMQFHIYEISSPFISVKILWKRKKGQRVGRKLSLQGMTE